MSELSIREQFVAYPLDGGLLFFHPQSGVHLRLHGDSFAHHQRQAPRVVMFGITNECNLQCSFCSRETSQASQWTEDSAFSLLQGLAQVGTLEVAFGGGEPFAFPDFAALLKRLHTETALALHVTTNGTLIDRDSWPSFAGLFGQVRVSIYNKNTWKRCSKVFREFDQLWGANILVDDATLETLPELLEELHLAGCNDVSLLGYIGEEQRILSENGKRKLADIVRESPATCRVSLCFGEELPLPRLMAGYDNQGDCGAGSDFISISSSGTMQSCSFMSSGFRVTSANDVLSHWHEHSARLRAASTRSGCARTLPQLRKISPMPALSVWRGFSGNNSGECVMVATFGSPDDAEQYLEELLPGWRSMQANTSKFGYPSEWIDLFHNERVTQHSTDTESEREAPDSLLSFGSTVFAVGYGLSDLFPELRALAWKRGAHVLPGGLHVHGDIDLFSAIRCKSPKDRDSLIKRSAKHDVDCYPYGDFLFLHQIECDHSDTLKEVRQTLLALADGRPHASELFYLDTKLATITDALKSLGQPVEGAERLWIRFFGFDSDLLEARTTELVEMWSDQTLVRGKGWILLDPVRGRKRAAVLAYRRGATVAPLDVRTLKVEGYFWIPRPYGKNKQKERRELPGQEVFVESLHRHGIALKDLRAESMSDYNRGVQATVLTANPGQTLLAMEATASALDVSLHLSIDAPKPLAMTFRRLLEQLKHRV